MAQPRGIRNQNPGNLRKNSDPWQGLAAQTDAEFFVFKSAAYGIRALARTLITYQDKHNLNTVAQIIERWAPPSENDTDAYVSHVCALTGFGAHDLLDMQHYADLRMLTEAIIRHENGKGPLKTINSWYDDATIDKGLELAGVRRETPVVSKVPVTKETVGATATGGVGVAQLADAAPHVVDAVVRQQDSLSSGSIAQIVIGVVLVGLAVFIAWSQVKKHQAGTV